MSLFSRTYRVSTAGTTLSCGGLDGARHGVYRLYYYFWFDAPSGTSNVYLRPNGLSTNLVSDQTLDQGTPAANTDWRIGLHRNSGSADAYFYGKALLFCSESLSGNTVRIGFMSDTCNALDTGANHERLENNGVRLASTTLTSVSFVSSSENFGVGSFAYIEQLTPDNALA